jgi:hypothetical protein
VLRTAGIEAGRGSRRGARAGFTLIYGVDPDLTAIVGPRPGGPSMPSFDSEQRPRVLHLGRGLGILVAQERGPEGALLVGEQRPAGVVGCDQDAPLDLEQRLKWLLGDPARDHQ